MKLQKQVQCAFIGCTNTFTGPPQKKYCDDPRCIKARRLLAQKKRKNKIEKDVENLTISKGKFATGTILNIQCAASGPAGRCTKSFVICYNKNRTTYPRYCEQHRNAYQRARFEGKI